MTSITMSDGKIVLREGKVGTETDCCCDLCKTCPDECCVLINERDTCSAGESGTFPNDGYEAWGLGSAGIVFPGGSTPVWMTFLDSAGGCGSGGVQAIWIEIGECVSATGKTPITVTSQQTNGDETCPDADHWGGRRYRWDGVLTKDENGCPTGFTLDEESKVTEYGVDLWIADAAWDSGIEPLDPRDYITFECNPLP
jgi:hypothetical protein